MRFLILILDAIVPCSRRRILPRAGRLSLGAVAAPALLVVAAGGALAAETAGPPASLPRTQRLVAAGQPVRIILYGDSISEVKKGWSGGARSPKANWGPRLVARLAAAHPACRFTLQHFAVGGENTRDGLARLGGLAALEPDLVLVAFGANDCCHRFLAPAETAAALTELVTGICRLGADVVVVGTGGDNPRQPFFRHLDETLAAQRAVAAREGVPFVDIRAAVLAATGDGRRWAEFHIDAGNCHPTDAGHDAWAAAASAAIEAAWARPGP